VSKEEEGKRVDSKCHKLTASFQRERHRKDNRVPLCSYYEVKDHQVFGCYYVYATLREKEKVKLPQKIFLIESVYV